jgi:branched-chain amino acid transport system substrate-binding protein
MTISRLWAIAVLCSAIFTGLASASLAADCGLNTGKAATGEPIAVGAIVTASGAVDFSTGVKGAKAYFDCVNANGGIHGRPIAYTYEDDQTRPDRVMEMAKKLIEDRKSVALVGSSSVVDCITTAQYYAQSGIISLMGTAVAPHCFVASNIAMLNAGPRYGGLGAVKYAVEKLGSKHIICPQSTVPGSDWICDGIEEFAKSKGLAFSRFPVDPTTVDNDSFVQQIVQTGGDTVIYNGSVPSFLPFLAAAERADAAAQIKFLFPMTLFSPDVPKAIGPYWNDRIWVNLEYAPPSLGGPDAQNYLEVMKAANVAPDALAQGGYLAARLFTAAILKLDPTKIDRASVTAALENVQDFKSDMLCKPWAFGPKDAKGRLGNRSGLSAQIHDNSWQVNQGCVTLTDKEVGR